jgi:hypothetical protein
MWEGKREGWDEYQHIAYIQYLRDANLREVKLY